MKSLQTVLQHREMIPTVRQLQEKFAGQGRNCSFWEANIWSLCAANAKVNLAVFRHELDLNYGS